MKRIAALFLLFAFMAWAHVAQATDVPRTPTTTSLKDGAVLFTWAGLDGDDTGIPVEVGACKDLTVHVYSSTYGSSTITVEGSLDPLADPRTTTYNSTAEWVGLTDPQGNAISKTADGIEAVEEHPRYFRPKTASGTAAAVSVGLICKK